jgi:2,3-bisphosphoglycerate-independent phosphoglycerate mutase
VKHLLFIIDGAADYPCRELGGRTPLEAARAPNLDSLTKRSALGRVKVSGGARASIFSDTAFLSILGLDETEYPGRGPLEALALGVKLSKSDVAVRCNLVAEDAGRAGKYLEDLTQAETRAFVASLNELVAPLGARFVHASGYRHLLILKNAKGPVPSIVPPKPGEPLSNANVTGIGKIALALGRIVRESQKLFLLHPSNSARVRAGKKPVATVWFWGAGRLTKTMTFKERLGAKTAIISAVDVVKGIGKWLGAEMTFPKGGEARVALKALKTNDFVIVHVQAPDEAGHEGDAKKKTRAIEDFDTQLLGPCLKALRDKRDCRIAVIPDHFTPVSLKAHAADPVPFLLYRPGVPGEGAEKYCEASAKKGSAGTIDGKRFMRLLFGPAFEAKAVVFDLWSTLLQSSKRKEWELVKKALGITMPYEEYQDLQVIHWSTSNQMDERAYYAFFMKKLGLPADEKAVARLARIWRTRREETKLFPDAPATLAQLAKKHPLAVVSNTEPDGPRLIEEEKGIAKFFKAIVHSCDAGLRKPDPRIFALAAKRLGVKPGECVMVGDNPFHDVEGAQKAGMRGVLVDRKKKPLGGIKPDAVVDSLAELVESNIL